MDVSREIAGETLTFLPQKAVYWPRRKTLMVADLHWGKAETFQKAGIPVSSEILGEDLARLAELVKNTGAERVLLLGDLLHGRSALTADLRQRVAAWRRQCTPSILLVEGNHDKNSAAIPPEWEFEILENELRDEPFVFAHQPPRGPAPFTWCGHLHPVLQISRRIDSMRLPCFWLRPQYGVLPSFGSFTGGMHIDRQEGDEVLVIADDEVLTFS